MFTKRRSDSALPYALGLPSPGTRSARSSSTSLLSPAAQASQSGYFDSSSQPQQAPSTVDRATLHQTLAATSELLISLDAAREAAAALASAERSLAKNAAALAKLFGPKAPAGADCAAAHKCLTSLGGMFEAVAEVDGRHAGQVKGRYEAANGIADKWFKRTAKAEKTFATDMTDLDSKVDKAHASYAKQNGLGGGGGGGMLKFGGGGGGGAQSAQQAIANNNKYVSTLAYLTQTIQSLQVQHGSLMAEQRERAVGEIARIGCELAQDTWNNRINGMRAAGVKVAEIKQAAAWCAVGMPVEEEVRAVEGGEGLQLTNVDAGEGSLRGPRSMPAEGATRTQTNRDASQSTEHASRNSLSSGGEPYPNSLSMAPLRSPTTETQSQSPSTSGAGGRPLFSTLSSATGSHRQQSAAPTNRVVSGSTDHSSRQSMSSGGGQYASGSLTFSPLSAPAQLPQVESRRPSLPTPPSTAPKLERAQSPPAPSSIPQQPERVQSPPTLSPAPVPQPTPTARVASPPFSQVQERPQPQPAEETARRYSADYFNQRPGTSDVSCYTHDVHAALPPPEGPQAAWGDALSSGGYQSSPQLRQTSSFVMTEPVRSPVVEALEAQVSPVTSDEFAHKQMRSASPKIVRSDSRVAKLVQRYSLPPIATTPALTMDRPSSLTNDPRTLSPAAQFARSVSNDEKRLQQAPQREEHPSFCSCAQCTVRNYRQREGGELSRKEEMMLQKGLRTEKKGLRTEKKGTFGRMFGGGGGEKKRESAIKFARA